MTTDDKQHIQRNCLQPTKTANRCL